MVALKTDRDFIGADDPERGFGRVDLVERVAGWIRERIFSGVVVVGAELPSEGALATELGVSRNVIREAMRNLRIQRRVVNRALNLPPWTPPAYRWSTFCGRAATR